MAKTWARREQVWHGILTVKKNVLLFPIFMLNAHGLILVLDDLAVTVAVTMQEDIKKL